MKKSSARFTHLRLRTKNSHSIICDADDVAGQRVIVKSLRTDVVHDWAVERLRNEAQILRHLVNVEGVPTLVDFFWLKQHEGNPQPILVTEKMPGQTLQELRKTEPQFLLSIQQCLTLLKHISSVLMHVHSRGIVHRDIKLGNILVAPNNRVSIIDWGTAAPINSTPKEQHVIGTVQFMSYEQITNQVLDARTDIYSLGVLMTLLAYGEHLTPRYVIGVDGKRTQRTSDEIADQVARGETIKYELLPTPRNVHEQTLQDVLRKMTQWDRSKRFQTMRALITEL